MAVVSHDTQTEHAGQKLPWNATGAEAPTARRVNATCPTPLRPRLHCHAPPHFRRKGGRAPFQCLGTALTYRFADWAYFFFGAAFLAAGLRAAGFFAGARRAGFFAGPLARLSARSSTARSGVSDSTVSPRGIVTFVVPSVM